MRSTGLIRLEMIAQPFSAPPLFLFCLTHHFFVKYLNDNEDVKYIHLLKGHYYGCPHGFQVYF